MSTKVTIPPALAYTAGPPTQQALLERREALRQAHDAALDRVTALARDQEALSRGLGEELAGMQADGASLDELEAAQAAPGLLAALSRSLSRRRTILARRSVTESLLQRYERASLKLREASAFCDELRLTGLELQEQVVGLHEELARVARDERASARRVLALEAALDALERGEEPAEGTRETARVRVAFEERTEVASLELLRVRVALLQQELGPAEQLRDTVMTLHEEVGRFVLQATSAVDTAGRRIQALGMAADAPTVVAELSESLTELGEAMQVTEQYVRTAQDLVGRVLPEVRARLEAEQQVDRLLLSDEAERLDRTQARALADQALREAAAAEVAALAGELDG